MKCELKVNYKLVPFLTKPQPIKVAVGGRGSGKSIGFGDMLTFKMDTERADIYCLREFQDSIADSVHKVFTSSIKKRLMLQGWEIQKNTIIAPNGASTTYKGANRNPDAMQSAQDYKYSWFEEAHRASQESLDKLLPTIIRNPGAQCWFSANAQSSADPFSKRFIVPYKRELDMNGVYEDDLHYIVVVNWRDNPWWNEEQEMLRSWDYDNLPRGKYNWIWEGEFNDSVEDALILAEWFDACIDAHKKLGFEPIGARMSAHDPSDIGPDSKGYAFRHGSVVIDIQEKIDGNVNEGGDWATGLAIKNESDTFTWDCDGLGVGLNAQVNKAFGGKHTIISQFKGSECVDKPDAVFMPAQSEGAPIQGQKTNKQALKNKRAQYYYELRERVYKTYLAVEEGKYINPDELLSFDSNIDILPKLRSELCRMPIKPNGNGLFELYTKQEMKTKFKFQSPNLADSVMMLMRSIHRHTPKHTYRPMPIKTIGRR